MTELSVLSSSDHPYVSHPHRTFITLSIPVLFSMVAEPVTGLVDTAFIARLGEASLAALGVGSVLLSGIFWVFNFLGVGSQTEVGQALGRNETGRAAEIGYLAMLVGSILGVMVCLIGRWFVPSIVTYMGAVADVHGMATRYITIRLFGAPAVLLTLAAFGILRGMQDMRTPLWIAVTINLLNIVLDASLIFGMGPFPALGVAGAAIATVVSQWVGAVIILLVVYQKLGMPPGLKLADTRRLFQIGGDMFIRTGLLLFYLLMATRTATKMGTQAGAAHQAIRQFWTFTALFLDAYSVTAQSLIAFFIGRGEKVIAKHVARTICFWSFVTGCLMSAVMLWGQSLFSGLLVPAGAVAVFTVPWWIASFSQPVSSIAFATDGIHWGTGDFAYLRNGMIAATSVGLFGIYLLETSGSSSLEMLWYITAAWIFVRAVAGIIRVWPGIGRSPLANR
jgi:MATE family multidrug resistance protein